MTNRRSGIPRLAGPGGPGGYPGQLRLHFRAQKGSRNVETLRCHLHLQLESGLQWTQRLGLGVRVVDDVCQVINQQVNKRLAAVDDWT